MKLKRILTGLIFTLIHTYSSGQENQQPVKDSIKKNEISISEVTVSAMRFPEKKKFIAQQVYSISSGRIEQLNQPNTADLLMQTGQVLVQKSQMGGGSPVIRGFEANKVLIVIDGIRMNNAIYRGGHLQNVITIDNQALEKAEVLAGPSSVIYGSDALGGVMSFFTKSPEFAEEKNKKICKGTGAIRYASALGEMNAHADMKIGSKNFASFSSLTFSRFGDLRQGRKKYSDFPDWGSRNYYQAFVNGRDTLLSNPDPDVLIATGYSQFDLVQKFLLKTGKIKQGLNIQFSTTSDIPRFDRLTETDSAGVFKSAEWYYGPQRRWLAAWNLELPAGRFYDGSKITIAWQDILESRHNRNFGSYSLKNRKENVQLLSLNADFSRKKNNSEWYYGIEACFNHVSSTAFAENIISGEKSSLDTRYPDGGSRTMNLAAYTSLIHKFNEKWVLNGGIRVFSNHLYSRFNDTSFFPFPFREIRQNVISAAGNAGLIWFPGKDWKMSLLLSTGFRTPNVDDMSKVFESNAGYLIVPNPELKPERTLNYELGISKRIKGNFQATATLWYTGYQNILTVDSARINGQSTIIYDGTVSDVFTTLNKNKAFLWGSGLNISAQAGKYFSFSGSVQYSFGRIIREPKNYPLDHIPPVYGRLGIQATKNKWNGEFYWLFNGRKDSSQYNLKGEDNQLYSADPVRGFTPGWSTLNLRITLKINYLISAQVAMENILDKYYRTFASGMGAPGRNLVISLRAGW